MKKYFISTGILSFRIIDLYLTDRIFRIHNSMDNELNLLVRYFKIKNKYYFYLLELLFAFILIFFFLFYLKNKNLFYFKSKTFKNYIVKYFFKKDKINLVDFFFKINIKRTLIFFGQLTPFYVIATSLIYILNNWLVLKGTKDIYYYQLYYKINNIIPFTFTIYILPIILFVLFSIYLLHRNFIMANRKFNL